MIRELIRTEGSRGRTHLSERLCRLWDWRQPNGHYREIACRDALRQLHGKGLISLPPAQCIICPGRRVDDKDPTRQQELLDRSGSIDLEPSLSVARETVKVLPAVNTKHSRLFNQLIQGAHYLGYHRPTGACLKYIAWYRQEPIGCLSFGPAAWRTAARDQWIGWSDALRQRRLHLIVNNDRFLILPRGRRDHLASFVLAASLRRLAADWEHRYCYRPVLAETFVENRRFRGTCYAAANWQYLGQTTGRGRNDRFTQIQAPIKSLWVYPLQRNFREVLSHG